MNILCLLSCMPPELGKEQRNVLVFIHYFQSRHMENVTDNLLTWMKTKIITVDELP